jgi:hypothetical protein
LELTNIINSRLANINNYKFKKMKIQSRQ